MKTSESIVNISAAFVRAQGVINDPAKGTDNAFFSTKYADLHAVLTAIREAFAPHGLGILQFPYTDENGRMGLETRIIHESGEWIEPSLPITVDLGSPKNVGQAVGSLTTYFRRYCAAAAAGVAQADDDGNAIAQQATPQKVRADERAEGRADGPRYTPEEHAEFRLRLMSEDTDPAEFFCFMKQRTAEVQADLNSSWEYGKGTKMQAKTRDLEAEGQRHMTAIFDAFGVAMGTGDLSLVAETWTEFTNDQRQVMRRKLASDRDLERFVDEAINTIPESDLPAKQLEVVT